MPSVRGAFIVALVAVAVVSAGCGRTESRDAAPVASTPFSEPPVTTAPTPPPPPAKPKKRAVKRSCHPLMQEPRPDYRYCEFVRHTDQVKVTLEHKDGGTWTVVTRVPTRMLFSEMGEYWGVWGAVSESPDGRWLLLDWEAECENTFAFLAPAAGGRARSVIGRIDWDTNSRGIGWAPDGRARVAVAGGCGAAALKSGEYLIDPATLAREYVG